MTTAGAAVVAVGCLPVPSASAVAGGRVVAPSGDCSGVGTWDLKVQQQDHGLQVEAEIDINRGGQRWRVRLVHNGHRVLNTVGTTRAPSGSFTIRMVQANRAGTDRFRMRGVRLDGGNTCAGRIRF